MKKINSALPAIELACPNKSGPSIWAVRTNHLKNTCRLVRLNSKPPSNKQHHNQLGQIMVQKSYEKHSICSMLLTVELRKDFFACERCNASGDEAT